MTMSKISSQNVLDELERLEQELLTDFTELGFAPDNDLVEAVEDLVDELHAQNLEIQDASDDQLVDEMLTSYYDGQPPIPVITEDASTVAGVKPTQSDLVSSLIHLLVEFDPERTAIECQQLVETYGFVAFKDAFDNVLMKRGIINKSAQNERLANGLREVNQFILGKTADTFSVMVFDGAKSLSTGLSTLLNRPNSEFEAQARILAAKDAEKSAEKHPVRVLAREALKKKTESALKEIKKSKEDADVQAQKIAALQEDKIQKLEQIDTMPIPLDYYIEMARFNALKEERAFFLSDVAQNLDLITAYIKKDLLFTDDARSPRDLLKLRTLKLERYILMAEKLLDAPHANAALAIFTAIISTEIKPERLQTTFGGLSPYAQEQFKRMEILFNQEKNYGVFAQYAEAARGEDYLLPVIISRDLEGANTGAMELDEHGYVTVSLNESPVYKRIFSYCEVVDSIAPTVRANGSLLTEVIKDKFDFSRLSPEEFMQRESERQKAMSALTKRLYDTSQELEPRGQYIKPKSMERYEGLMRPARLESLHTLIRHFHYSKADNLREQCQKLVETHGFSKFTATFDTILSRGDLTERKERKALKIINQYIMHSLTSNFTAVALESSQHWAKAMTDILAMPRETFQEKALAAAEKDSYAKAKGAAIRAIKKSGAAQINQIESNDTLSEDEKKVAIHKIQQEASDKTAAVGGMVKMPLDYYIEKERWNHLLAASELETAILVQHAEMTTNYVLHDIVSKTSIDSRTIAMERYVLAAEKLIEAGELGAALPIYTALVHSSVDRLKATREGLSQHAQHQLSSMDALFKPSDNYRFLQNYCKENDLLLPPNVLLTMVTLTGEAINLLIQVDEQGHATPLKDMTINTIELLVKNATAIMRKEPLADLDVGVAKELAADVGKQGYEFHVPAQNDKEGLAAFAELRTERKKAQDTHLETLYQESIRAEPRLPEDQTHEPSDVVSGLKRVLRSGVLKSFSEEKKEQAHALLARIEAKVSIVRADWDRVKKSISTDFAEKAGTLESKFSSFFNSVNEFIQKSKDTLLHVFDKKPKAKDLSHLDDEELRDRMDDIIDDLLDYHAQHDGVLEQISDELHQKKDTANPERRYTGGIEGQKRYYTAVVVSRLQTLMATGFEPEAGSKIYNYLNNFIDINWMMNKSAVNDLVGKEPTLVRLVREKVLPIVQEMAHRKGYDFTYTAGGLERYHPKKSDSAGMTTAPSTAGNPSVTMKERLQHLSNSQPGMDEDKEETNHP